MYDQLEPLWQRLKVDPEDMDAFVDVNRGSTEECVRAYEEELERMLELKRERMGEFIQSAREQILRLWDELMTGEEERGAFGAFVDDEHTEELFGIHEEEIRKLQEEKRLKAPLLASVRKYFEICDEERELAAAANDQTRLTGRGSRDPGRLLREEKMRKRVQKEKPRVSFLHFGFILSNDVVCSSSKISSLQSQSGNKKPTGLSSYTAKACFSS